MRQEIIDLYDEYTHRPLPRRVFLERLADLAGGSAAALALLPLLEPNAAKAATIAPDDPRLKAGPIFYTGSTGGDVQAYEARPKDATGLPGVIVIHENRGLNPHIRDVTRRLAVEGFYAMAPDLLSAMGGTPADPDKARDMIGKLDRKVAVRDLVEAVTLLSRKHGLNGKVGCVGFCWGGGMANQLAVADPDLDAAVVYYGPTPDPAEVPKIKAHLLLHYAGLDKRIDEGVPAYERALQAAGIDYKIYMYEGVNHAFNNDTSAERYNAAAAKLAWERTIAFLHANLKA